MEAHERKPEPTTVPMSRLLDACAAADAVSTPPGTPGTAPAESAGEPGAPEASGVPPGSGRGPAEDGGRGAEAA
ncbi:hypothetical protein CUT44_26500 [Streptomyces carminius]|uniref:Uncharacterized protein n=1 Tax=Streptomyces carminius TaxID=2665496 RepID=A0A2M8LRX6_9ACTN|nr:hypothetical protein [Streptomyces carminius]PJE94716.1 hypothetical protein CUT44_26500 [Streptomyces carminius]